MTIRTLSALLALTVAPIAHAQIYKCVDGDGRVTYTNERTTTRGCTQMSESQSVSSIPLPPAKAPAAQPQSTPSSFPRVTPDAQRARDDTRRQVLEKELSTEESALAEAQKALAEQESIRHGNERNYQKVIERAQPFKDKVELHQRNIEALRREIGNLK